MKRTPFPVSARIALHGPGRTGFVRPGPETTRKVLYSLQPGETIMRAESTIAIAAGAADIVLVTTMAKDNKGPFFVVRDGKRTGPFTGIKETMATAYAAGRILPRKNRDCASYTPPRPPRTRPRRQSRSARPAGRQIQGEDVRVSSSHLLGPDHTRMALWPI